jgi:hypothetical protein
VLFRSVVLGWKMLRRLFVCFACFRGLKPVRRWASGRCVGKAGRRFWRVSRVSRAEAGAASEKQKLGEQKAEIRSIQNLKAESRNRNWFLVPGFCHLCVLLRQSIPLTPLAVALFFACFACFAGRSRGVFGKAQIGRAAM